MFESAELGHKISKETWNKEVPLLREAIELDPLLSRMSEMMRIV